MIISMMTLTFAGACTNETIDVLNYEGKEIVIKIGEDKYISADELFDNLVVNKNNMQYVYEEIRELVIKTAAPIDQTMRNNIAGRYDRWDKEVRDTASVNNISLRQAKETALRAEGVTSEDELRDKWYLELQTQKVTERYWKEAESEYYKGYLSTNLPFHISEVRVNLSIEPNLDMVNKTITNTDAKKIAGITTSLLEGERFYRVAERSDDSSTKDYGGDQGLVGLTSDIADEIKFALLAYAKFIQGADISLFDAAFLSNFYINGIEGVPLSAAKTLDSKSGNVTAVIGYDDRDNDALTTVMYPRNAIFNNLFNTKTFRFLVNDGEIEQELLDKGVYEELNVRMPNEETSGFGALGKQQVLVNTSGHPILVVRSESALHYISINKSPFDEDADKYFDANPDLNDDYISFIEYGYPESNANERKKQLEKFAREYATLGLYDDSSEKYIDYGMVRKYFDLYNIEIVDEELSRLFSDFLNKQIEYQEIRFENEINASIDVLSSKVELRQHESMQKLIIPLVCLETDSKCSFTFKNGFVYTPEQGGE